MEFHSLKQVQEMTQTSEKLQNHLCSKLLAAAGIFKSFAIFDIFRVEGYFGHRTQYGWPKVVPKLKIVKRMLGIADEEATTTTVKDVAKSKCSVQ
jgi:hypothetical protein